METLLVHDSHLFDGDIFYKVEILGEPSLTDTSLGVRGTQGAGSGDVLRASSQADPHFWAAPGNLLCCVAVLRHVVHINWISGLGTRYAPGREPGL